MQGSEMTRQVKSRDKTTKFLKIYTSFRGQNVDIARTLFVSSWLFNPILAKRKHRVL